MKKHGYNKNEGFNFINCFNNTSKTLKNDINTLTKTFKTTIIVRAIKILSVS